MNDYLLFNSPAYHHIINLIIIATFVNGLFEQVSNPSNPSHPIRIVKLS